MQGLYIPENYKNKIDLLTTEKAIKFIKDRFEATLAERLNLVRVSAPLFVLTGTGINDDLNGVERSVRFDIKELNGRTAEIVQSLAKWKRTALKKYNFPDGKGLYTDMNAIRRDDDMDNLHSIYVDQWDWERVIDRADRNLEFLKKIVTLIVGAIVDVSEETKKMFPAIDLTLNKDVTFITTQEAEDLYPDLSGKERENALCKRYGTVFLMQIGKKLKSGKIHDGRAPDYDDWELNGDVLFYNEVLQSSFEVSSMGIRVDEKSIVAQLKERGAEERLQYDYHQSILNGTLPLTIGGGIGQSRLCMLLLQKAHIGEVQVSLWPEDMEKEAAAHGIHLL